MDSVSNMSIYNNTMDTNETSTIVADTNTTLTPSTDAAPSSGIDPKDIEMISYVTVPLFFVLGLGGNISSITTMQTKSFRKSTICIYLTALALSDTTFILVGPFTKSFMKDIFGGDPKALAEAGCKIFFWVFRSAKICSSWFVVTICIERFIVVWFPLRAKIISTRRTAAISVLTVTSLVLTFDGIWTITTGIVNGACLPTVVTDSTKDLSAAFVIAGTAIFNIIPTCVLLLFTPLTAFKLFRQQSFRREMNVSAINADAMRVTRMLVSISCAYIILVTPISVAHSVAFFNGDNIFESTNPRFIVFREFAQILEQLNYCVNFFLYITFNVTFRQSFLGIFKCGRTNDVTRNVITGSPDDVDKKSLKSSSSSSSTTNTSLTPDVLG